MKGLILGSVTSLALAGLGLFWWQGRAQVEEGAPPPVAVELAKPLAPIPESDPGDLLGPEPPEASELSKEQQRFFRYDRNRDWRISRVEMLSTRSDAFRKLDKDGNNLLDFEEWAVATVEKFESADANEDNQLSPTEFATTKPKPVKKRRCAC
ncbi:MAG: hypothetical protein R3E14_14010 [Erythrobacter sp.]